VLSVEFVRKAATSLRPWYPSTGGAEPE
jgi:hypothetical protein